MWFWPFGVDYKKHLHIQDTLVLYGIQFWANIPSLTGHSCWLLCDKVIRNFHTRQNLAIMQGSSVVTQWLPRQLNSVEPNCDKKSLPRIMMDSLEFETRNLWSVGFPHPMSTVSWTFPTVHTSVFPPPWLRLRRATASTPRDDRVTLSMILGLGTRVKHRDYGESSV